MRDPVAPSRACPACGAANAGYATFCLECGEPLDGASRRTPHSVLGRREVALGLALVLLVLGYAVWDWRHAEDQAQAYDAGVRAAAAQDWDAAAGALASLDNYYDAPQRLATARDAIRRRDTAFNAGQAAAARQDWLGAYRAYSETLAIQPTYRNTPALFVVARDRAVAAALTGTLYLQFTGPVPGLYRRDPASGTPIHLLESDGRSVVRRYNAAQQWVIYDGLAPGVLTSPPQTGQPAARRLWLAGLAATDPAPVVLPETVDLAQDIMLPVRGGVWVYRTGIPPDGWQDLADLSTEGHLRGGTWLERLSYFDAAGGTLTDRLPPGTAALLDGDELTGRLLLGVPNLADPAGRHTRLLLLTPDQPTPRLVADVPGLIDWAGLRTGATALAYTAGVGALAYNGAAGVTGPITALELAWLDLQAPRPSPRGLTNLVLTGYEPLTSLRGAWVPGPGPPRLVVRRVEGSSITLSAFAVDTGAEAPLWTGPLTTFLSTGAHQGESYYLAPDGRGVFFVAPTDASGMDLQPHWLPLDPATPPAPFPLLPPAGEPITAVGLPAGTDMILLFRFVYSPSGSLTRDRTTVYRLAARQPAEAPTVLFHSDQAVQLAGGLFTDPQLLPGQALAWVDGDGLHLRPLDGDGDLPTLPDVAWAVPLADPPPEIVGP